MSSHNTSTIDSSFIPSKKPMYNAQERMRRATTERLEKPRHSRKPRTMCLLDRFRPPVPDTLLPKDPRPNYRPLYLQAQRLGLPSARFVCTACDFRYDSERLLRAHCEGCGKSGGSGPSTDTQKARAEQSDSLERKSSLPLVNANAKKCPHCDAVLAYAYNLSKHIENRHNVPTGRHHCRLCCYKGDTKDDLQKHRESRHRRCPYCQIRFTTERGMNRHIHDCPSGPRNGRS